MVVMKNSGHSYNGIRVEVCTAQPQATQSCVDLHGGRKLNCSSDIHLAAVQVQLLERGVDQEGVADVLHPLKLDVIVAQTKDP